MRWSTVSSGGFAAGNSLCGKSKIQVTQAKKAIYGAFSRQTVYTAPKRDYTIDQ
jgi:hypothetical protein